MIAPNLSSTSAFLWHYVRPYRLDFFIGCLCVFVSSSSLVGLGLGIKHFVNVESPWLEVMAAFGGFAAAMCLSIFGRIFFVNRGGQRMVGAIRRDIHSYILGRSPEFFQKYRAADLLSVVISDISILENFIAGGFTIMLRHSLTMFASLGLVFYSNFHLALDVLLVVPIGVLIILTLGGKVKKLSKSTRSAVGSIGVAFEDSVATLKLIQSFCCEPVFERKFNQKVDACSMKFIGYSFYRALLVVLIILSVISIVMLVLWQGISQLHLNRTDTGSLLSFLFYVLMAVGGFSGFSDGISDLQQSSAAVSRVMDLMQDGGGLKLFDKGANKTPPQVPFQRIEFQDVSFSYPSRRVVNVLSGCSVAINAGETLALVGRSGAGKSTVFNLLMRFYDVDQGKILIDGVDIRDLPITELRKVFGWVPQESCLIAGTIGENLRFGDELISNERLMVVLEQVDLLQFIESLPQGIETQVGEKGCDFSGGQKQRLSIARALLKEPQVLLFDEATSSLDSNSEAIIQNTLFATYRNKTKVIIAHRLSTIINSDKIIVMDQGMVTEVGNHQELIALGGLYSKLIQANIYAEEQC